MQTWQIFLTHQWNVKSFSIDYLRRREKTNKLNYLQTWHNYQRVCSTGCPTCNSFISSHYFWAKIKIWLFKYLNFSYMKSKMFSLRCSSIWKCRLFLMGHPVQLFCFCFLVIEVEESFGSSISLWIRSQVTRPYLTKYLTSHVKSILTE